ncbi:hypothetical protein D3C84_940610 [compost metagenome]
MLDHEAFLNNLPVPRIDANAANRSFQLAVHGCDCQLSRIIRVREPSRGSIREAAVLNQVDVQRLTSAFGGRINFIQQHAVDGYSRRSRLAESEHDFRRRIGLFIHRERVDVSFLLIG